MGINLGNNSSAKWSWNTHCVSCSI